jgi:hypothetical protein
MSKKERVIRRITRVVERTNNELFEIVDIMDELDAKEDAELLRILDLATKEFEATVNGRIDEAIVCAESM